MSKLYIVATPIGNLEDITLRALRILKEVDFILCEDTRVTKKLLNRYEIKASTISYHSQSGIIKIEKIIDLLKEGNDLALVSDAGTPTISDPGNLLVSKIREQMGDNVEIIVIPGASALTSSLSISGLPSSTFLFLGFLPRKKGRTKLFEEITESKRPVVFYESPHRILKTLDILDEYLKNRKIVIAREMTKIYEEVVSGTARELKNHFENNPKSIKGEFVVLIEGK